MEVLFTAVVVGSTAEIAWVTISTDGTEYCWQYSSYNVGHNQDKRK